MAAVQALNHYKINCPKRAAVTRNIWALQVSLGLHLEVRHIAGTDNTVADALSRLKGDPQVQAFRSKAPHLELTVLDPHYCELNYDI